MAIFLKHRHFRYLSLSQALNYFGAGIYNIAFIIYASTQPNPKLAILLADVIVIVPILFNVWTGRLADRSRQPYKRLIQVAGLQAGLFLLAMPLLSIRVFWAFLFLCGLNIFSDILSEYAGNLKLPLYQRLLAEEELTEAFGFNHFLTNSVSIIAQALGVALLSVLGNNFSWLAAVNALVYALSGLVLLFDYKSAMARLPRQTISESKEIAKGEKQSILRQLKTILGQLQAIFEAADIPNFYRFVLAIILTNFAGSPIISVYSIGFLTHNPLPFGYGTTLMLVNVAYMAASMLSGLWTRDFTQQWSLLKLHLLGSLAMIVLLLASAFNLNGYVCIGLLVLAVYLFVKVNVKFNALLVAHVPSEVLATSASAIGTVNMLLIPFGIFLFTTIATLYSASLSFGLMALVMLVVVSLVISMLRQTSKQG